MGGCKIALTFLERDLDLVLVAVITPLVSKLSWLVKICVTTIDWGNFIWGKKIVFSCGISESI